MSDLRKEMPWLAFWSLRYSNPTQALKFIADQIRNGCNDPTFIRQLANSIDPDANTMTGVKFVISRPGGKRRPKAAPNHELETFMQRHVIFFDESSESVCLDAAELFSVSRKTAENALSKARRRAAKNPEFEKMMRESSLNLKALGHPDMRTTSEILRDRKRSHAS